MVNFPLYLVTLFDDFQFNYPKKHCRIYRNFVSNSTQASGTDL
jgi:hypothetical protein